VAAGQLSMGGNCYSGVAIWLYLGGAVSWKWLKQYGSQPGGAVPKPWVWGPAIQNLAAAGNIPPGMICRFDRGGPCTTRSRSATGIAWA
jgi:hypothetical protein